MENEPIRKEIDGVTFLATGKYYDGINKWVSHKLKEDDHEVIDYAARSISRLLPSNAVIMFTRTRCTERQRARISV